MIRSFAFTTQGKLHSVHLKTFLMPTPLADTNCSRLIGKSQHPRKPLVLEDISTLTFVDRGLRVGEFIAASGGVCTRTRTAFAYLFIVVHAVDYSRKDEKGDE
jgi:hypothetical protein